jgi:hypothetical protein
MGKLQLFIMGIMGNTLGGEKAEFCLMLKQVVHIELPLYFRWLNKLTSMLVTILDWYQPTAHTAPIAAYFKHTVLACATAFCEDNGKHKLDTVPQCVRLCVRLCVCPLET